MSTTYYAASTSRADVNTAIGLAVAGDTVVIPAGSSSWTSGVNVTAGINLQGSGSGRIIAWSEPSQTIGTGSKTFTVQAAGLAISNGQTLRASRGGTRADYMEGTVTSYSGTTLVLNIATTAGSGSSTRWLISTVPTTVLINNVAGTMITMNEHASLHTRVRDIKIAAGTGTGTVVAFSQINGGLAMALHDCWIESNSSSGTSVEAFFNRGLIYNCSFDSSPFSMAQLTIVIKDSSNATGSWTALSTMGTADSTGESNLYVEDCDFHAWLNAFDNDDNGRMVVRHSTFNEAGFGTHGADTSLYGQRHFEVYNSTFLRRIYSDGSSFNMPRWFYIRGGTFVIFDNTFTIDPNGSDYGDPGIDMTHQLLNRGDMGSGNSCWGADVVGIQYPAPRQVGFGRVTGAAGNDYAGVYVGDSEPAYLWNNTGATLAIGTSDFGPSIHSSTLTTVGTAATSTAHNAVVGNFIELTSGAQSGEWAQITVLLTADTFTIDVAFSVDQSGTTWNESDCKKYDSGANYIVLGRDYINDGTHKPGYTAYTYPHPLRGEAAVAVAASPAVIARNVRWM